MSACVTNTRYLHTRREGQFSWHATHKNSVHKSMSSWWLAWKFLDGMRTMSLRSPFFSTGGLACLVSTFAQNERPYSHNGSWAARGHASRVAPTADSRVFSYRCGVGILFALTEGREQTDKKRLKYHGGILPREQPHRRIVEPSCRVYACALRFPGLVWLARTAPPEEWQVWMLRHRR